MRRSWAPLRLWRYSRTAIVETPSAARPLLTLRTPVTPGRAMGSAAERVSPSRRSVVRRLTILYTLALALIALIVLTYTGIRAISIAPQLAADVQAVDLVTKQEELAQRITQDGAVISSTTIALGDFRRAEFVDDIHSTQLLFEKQQAILRGSKDAPGLRGADTGDLDGRYAGVAPHYQAIVTATDKFLATFNASVGDIAASKDFSLALFVDIMVIETPVFTTSMEEIKDRYKADADGIQGREQTLDRILIGATLFALALVGLFVFRPATRRVGESIDELARAREQEHELATLKDQFIIYANHELRTPIMALYNSLELLDVATQRDEQPERRARLLQRALTSGETVIRLLRNVLDTGAIEAQTPRVEVTQVALEPLVRAALETFDPREIGEPWTGLGAYQSRAVTLDIPADMVVLADEGRVRQVLINLLSNALKYSEAGTPIAISVTQLDDLPRQAPGPGLRHQSRRSVTAADMAQVSVQDRGLGVPARDVPKLFNRFVRLERDIAGSVRGSGVGLYLCRVLVEAMGGRIWLESTGVPGEGSTFSFTLPLVTPTGDAGPATEVPSLHA
jgi:signal transduction histidine kinase